MVRMGMRDEDGVEVADGRRVRCRSVTAERPEPAAEYGIGQDADAVELDEERRVAEVRDPSAACPPGQRVSRCRSPGARAVPASRTGFVPPWSAASGST